MNEYEARQQAKRDRLRERAAKKRREADGLIERGSDMASVIPFGQPILVGHHSEKRDRNYRAKIDRTFERGFEVGREADRLEERAASVGKGGISSDDPDAVVKLKEKLAGLKKQQDYMKAANRAVRSIRKKHADDAEAQVAAIKAAGYPAELLRPDFCGRIGFPSYALQNNNANMRRIKQRIADLEARAGDETATIYEGHGLTVTDNVEANRVQLDFDAIPSRDVRQACKRFGFRWARSLGVWQRHRSADAVHYARVVAAAHERESATDDAFRGDPSNWSVYVGGSRLQPGRSLRLLNHSPSGFAWGYLGSGPAQLALAILLAHGLTDAEALDLYQHFKSEVVARWKQGDPWTLTRAELDAWLKARRENGARARTATA